MYLYLVENCVSVTAVDDIVICVLLTVASLVISRTPLSTHNFATIGDVDWNNLPATNLRSVSVFLQTFASDKANTSELPSAHLRFNCFALRKWTDCYSYCYYALYRMVSRLALSDTSLKQDNGEKV